MLASKTLHARSGRSIQGLPLTLGTQNGIKKQSRLDVAAEFRDRKHLVTIRAEDRCFLLPSYCWLSRHSFASLDTA